jgi:hypothetical protein
VLIISACKSALYIPVESMASPSASFEELKDGRKLYVDHCSSCHYLHLPSEYNKEQWQHQVDEMEQRAEINNQEKELILKYLCHAPVAAD